MVEGGRLYCYNGNPKAGKVIHNLASQTVATLVKVANLISVATVCFSFYLRHEGLNLDCTITNNYAPVSNENYKI